MLSIVPHRNRTSAFTLVEVLVVTAIIAILASILGVAIVNAKSDAKKAGCVANLHQMSLGVNTYLQDYDDLYPQTKAHFSFNPAVADADGSIDLPDKGSLFLLIGPYSGIGDCPANRDPDDEACSAIPSAGNNVNGYTVNGYFVFGLNQSQIVNGVASTILFSERRNFPSDDGQPPNCDVIYHPWYTPSNPLAPRDDMHEIHGALDTRRHFKGSDYLYADGHAVWREWGRVYNPDGNINDHKPY
jgi:prepilin-type N-terminal cleavage/methylation domain-containing protein